MPSPSTVLATQRADLGGSLEEFNLQVDREGFIATRVLPVFESAVQAGNYGIIPLEELLKSAATERAPGGSYNRGEWKFEPGTFATKEHGFEVPVDDRESKMYADYFSAEMVSAETARDVVLRNLEKRAAALLFDSGTFTTTNATTEWDTIATSVPITDVHDAVLRIRAATGLWANAIVMSRKVYLNLRRTTQILNHLANVRPTMQTDITAQDIGAAFDLPNVLIGGGGYNSSIEGQTAAVADVWDDEYVGVGVVATTSNIKEPCVGRTIHWSEDGSSIGAAMESYRDETIRGEVIRARMDTDEKLLYPAAFQLIADITT